MIWDVRLEKEGQQVASELLRSDLSSLSSGQVRWSIRKSYTESSNQLLFTYCDSAGKRQSLHLPSVPFSPVERHRGRVRGDARQTRNCLTVRNPRNKRLLPLYGQWRKGRGVKGTASKWRKRLSRGPSEVLGLQPCHEVQG